MDAARFTYEQTASGWRLQTDEPGLGGPLEGAFRYELRLGDLPAGLAVVGHCRVMGTWCVFARDAGSPVVRGIALRADRYGEHGYDPFEVAAAVLESQAARDAVGTGTSAQQGYLPEAHRRFLLGSPTDRQSLYCSVLPAGFPRRLSPLSCFVVEGGRPVADVTAGQAGSAGHEEVAPTPASSPQPPPPSLPTPRPTEPIPVSAPTTPLLITDSTDADEAPVSEREQDADDALERAVLRVELDRVERELSRRLRALWTALVVATVLLAAALAAGLWWTSKQLRRVEPVPPASRGTPPEGTGSWLP